MIIRKLDVTRGVQWIEIPEIDLRVLCGCPADAVKHLIKRGLIQHQEIQGLACETGPNAILLSDISAQNGEFANLAEFPVLQMLYKQGLAVPGHPNNSGRKPLLIGSAAQVESQMRYIYRGNYGLTSREELMEAGVPAAQADAMMRLKLAFAFGRIRPTTDLLEGLVVNDAPVEVAGGATVRRVMTNVFEFAYKGETVTVNLNLNSDEKYACPYPLGYRRFEPGYFSIIHSGEGDGWDVNRPGMSSIIAFQGKIYLIDAEPQLSHTMTALGIGIDQIDGIFQTHAHDDHFAGLTVLMRAGRRISYFAAPMVRHAVAKKLTALLGIEESHFADFFDIRDLQPEEWNDIEGLEVKPVFSPHPVETTVFVFRTLWGEGYRSYAHWGDIVSMDVLEGMVTDKPDAPGLDRAAFDRIRSAYAEPVDIKKIDIGGGMIHGNAKDFRNDASRRILLSHRASDLDAAEKEIGSSASFGIVDMLIDSQSDSLRRHAFGYLETHLPGLPLHRLRMLINHPIIEVNPGAIILKEGEKPQEVLLLLSGLVEKIRTRDNLFGNLSAGVLIGGGAVLNDRPANHTYRASSFLHMLQLPAALYLEVMRRNDLHNRHLRAADIMAFLTSTSLFEDGLPVDVLGRIVHGASEQCYRANESIDSKEDHRLNIVRSGHVQLSLGERVLDVLTEKDFFGEEGTIFKVPSLFGMRALGAVTVIRIPPELLEDVPILRWKLLEKYQQRAISVLQGGLVADKLIWSEALSIHVRHLNRQHERLIEIANIIVEQLGADAGADSLARSFDELIDYAHHHFDTEEKLMARHSYPATEDHCRKHADLVRQVAEYKERVVAGDFPDKARFQRFIELWLLRHIMQEDRKYGAFLNARGVF